MKAASSYATPRLDLGVAMEEFPLDTAGLIGTEVFPIFGTPKVKGSFSTITRESILRARNVKRSARGSYSRDESETDQISYECLEYGHEQPLDDSERQYYASDFDAEMVAAAMAKRILLQEQEKRVSALLFNTTTFTGSTLYTDLGTDWDSAASTIVADVEAAKQLIRLNCGMYPNTMVVSASALPWFKANTDLKSRVQYVAMLTDQAIVGALPGLLGIQKVLIAGGVKNTGGESETYAGGDIWDDNYCWLGVTANTGSLAEPCIGRTMLWTADSPDNATVEEYREEQTRSSVFRVRQYVDSKIFDPMFGHLLKIDT